MTIFLTMLPNGNIIVQADRPFDLDVLKGESVYSGSSRSKKSPSENGLWGCIVKKGQTWISIEEIKPDSGEERFS